MPPHAGARGCAPALRRAPPDSSSALRACGRMGELGVGAAMAALGGGLPASGEVEPAASIPAGGVRGMAVFVERGTVEEELSDEVLHTYSPSERGLGSATRRQREGEYRDDAPRNQRATSATRSAPRHNVTLIRSPRVVRLLLGQRAARVVVNRGRPGRPPSRGDARRPHAPARRRRAPGLRLTPGLQTARSKDMRWRRGKTEQTAATSSEGRTAHSSANRCKKPGPRVAPSLRLRRGIPLPAALLAVSGNHLQESRVVRTTIAAGARRSPSK